MWFKSDVMSAVESAMQRRSWKFARVDDRTVITIAVNEVGSTFIAINNDQNRKTLAFMMSPVKSGMAVLQSLGGGNLPFLRVHTGAGQTTAQVAQVCEALMDQNYHSLLGNLERDTSDGELRLRIAIPYRDASVTSEQVNWCIDIGVGSLMQAVFKVQEILGKGAVAPLAEV